MDKLKSGDKAPDFALRDQNGNIMKLADFKDKKKILLYFYPKALTAGCTTQAREVSAARKLLADLGVEAIGISPDQPEVLKKFDNNLELNFPLLSDADHSVAEAYDVWGEKSIYGKNLYGVIRSSFLIDENGQIIQAWYKVSPKDTVPKALQELK
jgi:thioredoxin-dependent peroxiredoxin